jgi:hypothetical protein
MTAHCLRKYEAQDFSHVISLQPWQCGGCGMWYAPGDDPTIWEEQLEDGRQTWPLCAACVHGQARAR